MGCEQKKERKMNQTEWFTDASHATEPLIA